MNLSTRKGGVLGWCSDIIDDDPYFEAVTHYILRSSWTTILEGTIAHTNLCTLSLVVLSKFGWLRHAETFQVL